jgi:hypothetical protein
MAIGLVAATAASTSTAFAAGHPAGIFLAVIVVLTLISVLLPDSHVATAVEAILVLQWLASVHDATTAWAIPIALCLFVFHVVIALLALTPVTATVGRAILVRWSRRSSWIVVATIGMWALVAAMAEREAPGNVTLTVVGFITLTVLIVLTRNERAASEHDAVG